MMKKTVLASLLMVFSLGAIALFNDIAFQRDIAALTKIPNLFDMCLAGIFRTFITSRYLQRQNL
jgi:hypothetical protein